jgi:hypothetical protein
MPTKRISRKRAAAQPKDGFEMFLEYASWLRSTFKRRMSGEDVPVPKEFHGYWFCRETVLRAIK